MAGKLKCVHLATHVVVIPCNSPISPPPQASSCCADALPPSLVLHSPPLHHSLRHHGHLPSSLRQKLKNLDRSSKISDEQKETDCVSTTYAKPEQDTSKPT